MAPSQGMPLRVAGMALALPSSRPAQTASSPFMVRSRAPLAPLDTTALTIAKTECQRRVNLASTRTAQERFHVRLVSRRVALLPTQHSAQRSATPPLMVTSLNQTIQMRCPRSAQLAPTPMLARIMSAQRAVIVTFARKGPLRTRPPTQSAPTDSSARKS